MNWKNLIAELLEAGWTQARIARAVGCSQPQIHDLLKGKRGKSLSYEIGSRLIALHSLHRKAA